MVELLILHIVSLRWTFDQSLKKILPLVWEIQSGHEIQGSNLWTWTMTLTLSAWLSYEFCTSSPDAKFKAQNHDLDLWPLPWVGMVDMGFAHRLTEVNIWPKFNENLSKGSGDMERTRKCYDRTDGWMDRQTDRWMDGQTKAISIIPHPLRGGGLIKISKIVLLH